MWLDAEPATASQDTVFEEKPPPLGRSHVPSIVKAATEIGVSSAVQVRFRWRLPVRVQCWWSVGEVG